MKHKNILSIILCALILLSAAGIASAADNYSSWAEPSIKRAEELGLITENVKKDYIRALSREHYCEMVVNMYEKRVGDRIETISNPFTDTSNPAIIKAYSLGVINGTSSTTFSPNRSVTREQAAVILINALRKIETERGVKILNDGADVLPFADRDKISSWALAQMKVAYANGIMVGDGTNVRPLANVSAQETVILILNAYNMPEMTPQDLGTGTPPVVALNSVTIPNPDRALKTGEKTGFDVQLSPATATVKTVAWSSSNTSVATIDASGTATARSAGTTTIKAVVTAADGTKKEATATLTVTAVAAVTVAIDGGDLPLKVNETVKLSYTLSDPAAVVSGVTWSSNKSSVATVDQSGNVKAVSKGSATITLRMTANGVSISATKAINVDPPIVALNSVVIQNPTRTIKFGDTSRFSVTLSPSTATIKSIEWSSSNINVATIDANGNATTKGAGTTTIKVVVTDTGGAKKEATGTLTVTAAIPVTSITFSKTYTDPMFAGTTRTIIPKIEPSGAVVVSKTWSSSAPSVATIDSSGRVSAISAGTTTIKLETVDRTNTRFSASFVLTVKANYVSSFTLGQSAYSIKIGETIYPELILSPPDAIVKSVSFTSDSNLSAAATVSSANRSVRGTKVGSGILTVKVTFEDNTSHTAQATITVLPNWVDSITLTANKTTLKVDGKYASDSVASVTYRINPSNASFISASLSSSDESVATVVTTSSAMSSVSRQVKAVSPGTCDIIVTVTMFDGSVVTERITITVIQN